MSPPPLFKNKCHVLLVGDTYGEKGRSVFVHAYLFINCFDLSKCICLLLLLFLN